MSNRHTAQGKISSQFKKVTRPKVQPSRVRTPPFSLRLTAAERSRLEQEAGSLSLGAYIRHRLLGDNAPDVRRHRRRPVQDHEALGRVLGELGKSRLANNLNQLAKAVNSGSLPVTRETEEALRAACASVLDLRKILLEALGLAA